MGIGGLGLDLILLPVFLSVISTISSSNPYTSLFWNSPASRTLSGS